MSAYKKASRKASAKLEKVLGVDLSGAAGSVVIVCEIVIH